MNNDFTTQIDRSIQGSSKWASMRATNPQMPSTIIPFSVADMEVQTPPAIKEGLKRFIDQNILGYTMPTERYYNAVINWMKKRHNWVIEKDWIVLTSGVMRAVMASVLAFSEENEGVIIFTPAYHPFRATIEKCGRKLVGSTLINNKGEYSLDLKDFETKIIAEKVKLCIFCNPHNPIGKVWTPEELKQVGDICLKHHVVIVSDEIHADLIMPGYKHTVFASLSEEIKQNIIICTSVSKTFNLAGLQISNIMIPNKKLRTKFQTALNYYSANHQNCISYEAVILGYEESEKWLDECINLIYTNYKLVVDFMKEYYPDVIVSELQGTYLLWMDFRCFGLDCAQLEKKLNEKAFLFFDEGYIFGEEGIGFERMNLACPSQTVVEALQRFKGVM